MNKEAPFSVIDSVNDMVNAKEDADVVEMFETVEMMEKRDKGSHTLRTHVEAESAKERLSQELERLSPTNVVYSED